MYVMSYVHLILRLLQATLEFTWVFCIESNNSQS